MNMTEPTLFSTATLQSLGLRGKLRHHVDMRRHTSWHAGGHAEHVYQPADLNDLMQFLRILPAQEPLLAIGLGSNLLVRDGGLRGTILLLHATLNNMYVQAKNVLYVEAGVPGAKIARFAALHNLWGAEFFAGIPGTMGGMLAMNAGCYGSETWDVVMRVCTLDRHAVLHEYLPDEYAIAYRTVHRIAQPAVAHAEFFVGAYLQLNPGDSAVSREAIKALLSRRIASQPLQLPNAGSVFRNPAGDYAARLIEQCGLKGRRTGGAQVSEKHANFIINTGNATAADIENLIHEIQVIVQEKTTIHLHPEVRIVGDSK